ncbi:MAG: RNA polymerase sigma factor [Sandaracinaceae bacterium]
MARTLGSPLVLTAVDHLDLDAVYEAHADFAWRSLARLGVADRDLADLLQEVFLVVHRRRADYDAGRPVRAWIWGICLGLARNYRRRAFRRLERLMDRDVDSVDARLPDAEVESRRARERGLRMLEALDPEKRAVFVMFEVEGLSGREIAEQLGVPVGTVHSRLHAARRELTDALAREGVDR